jgi:diguanylate cyclase
MDDFGGKVLAKIRSLNLKPLPQFYELWFNYFQGNHEIVRAIDTHQGEIDEVFCNRTHKRYLSEAPRDEAVRKISDQVQQSIAELVMTLSSVQQATSEYEGTLEDVSKKIESAKTLEDLGSVISGIVQDTKKMMQRNQDLELRLTSSSSQVEDLKKSLDNVRKEALTDSLTGLANRKALDRQIYDWTEESKVSGAMLSLLMLDIDHFKRFNDTYGHQTGDQVLRLVARTLTDGVKGRDFVARFGGEEFVILLPKTKQSDAVRVAESLRKAVEDKEIVNKVSNKSLGRIRLSIGVAQYSADESTGEFVERADAALYDAKKSGRNQVKAAAIIPLN